MRRNCCNRVRNTALQRADNFPPHDSDHPNSASEDPYSLNLPKSLGAWTEEHLLSRIRRWAPRARWLLVDRDIYGPGFSLAHQLFPGADTQRLSDANAMIARLLTTTRRKALNSLPWLYFAAHGELRRSSTRDGNNTRLVALRVETTNMPRDSALSAPGKLASSHGRPLVPDSPPSSLLLHDQCTDDQIKAVLGGDLHDQEHRYLDGTRRGEVEKALRDDPSSKYGVAAPIGGWKNDSEHVALHRGNLYSSLLSVRKHQSPQSSRRTSRRTETGGAAAATAAGRAPPSSSSSSSLSLFSSSSSTTTTTSRGASGRRAVAAPAPALARPPAPTARVAAAIAASPLQPPPMMVPRFPLPPLWMSPAAAAPLPPPPRPPRPPPPTTARVGTSTEDLVATAKMATQTPQPPRTKDKATQPDGDGQRGALEGLEWREGLVSASSVLALLSVASNRSGLHVWPDRPWPAPSFSSGAKNDKRHMLSHLAGFEAHILVAAATTSSSSSSSSRRRSSSGGGGDEIWVDFAALDAILFHYASDNIKREYLQLQAAPRPLQSAVAKVLPASYSTFDCAPPVDQARAVGAALEVLSSFAGDGSAAMRHSTRPDVPKRRNRPQVPPQFSAARPAVEADGDDDGAAADESVVVDGLGAAPPLLSEYLPQQQRRAVSTLNGWRRLFLALMRKSIIGASLPSVLESAEAAPVMDVLLKRLSERNERVRRRFCDFASRLFMMSKRDRRMMKEMSQELGEAYGCGGAFFDTGGGSESEDDADAEAGDAGQASWSESEFDRWFDAHVEVIYGGGAEGKLREWHEAKVALRDAHRAQSVAAPAGAAAAAAAVAAAADAERKAKAAAAAAPSVAAVKMQLRPFFLLVLSDPSLLRVLLPRLRKQQPQVAAGGVYTVHVNHNYDAGVMLKTNHNEKEHYESAFNLNFPALCELNHDWHSHFLLGLVNTKDDLGPFLLAFDSYFAEMSAMAPITVTDPVSGSEVKLQLVHFKAMNDMMGAYSVSGSATHRSPRDSHVHSGDRRILCTVDSRGRLAFMPRRNYDRPYSHSLDHSSKGETTDGGGNLTGLVAACFGAEFADLAHDLLHAGGRALDGGAMRILDALQQIASKKGLKRNPASNFASAYCNWTRFFFRLYLRQTTGRASISNQTGASFFHTMRHFTRFREALVAEAQACGGDDHAAAVGLYCDYYYKALAPCVHEDADKYKKATYYSALYCLLFLNLHVTLFGPAPISIRNLASDMPTQFADFAKLGMAARGGGARWRRGRRRGDGLAEAHPAGPTDAAADAGQGHGAGGEAREDDEGEAPHDALEDDPPAVSPAADHGLGEAPSARGEARCARAVGDERHGPAGRGVPEGAGRAGGARGGAGGSGRADGGGGRGGRRRGQEDRQHGHHRVRGLLRSRLLVRHRHAQRDALYGKGLGEDPHHGQRHRRHVHGREGQRHPEIFDRRGERQGGGVPAAGAGREGRRQGSRAASRRVAELDDAAGSVPAHAGRGRAGAVGELHDVGEPLEAERDGRAQQ